MLGLEAVGAVRVGVAPGNAAFANDPGNAVQRGSRGVRNVNVVVFGNLLDFSLLEEFLQVCKHFVFVLQFVNQAVLFGLGGEPRALIDDYPQRRQLFVAPFGDGGDKVAVDVIGNAVENLFRLCGHGAAGVHIAVVFVLAGVFDFHLDAEFVKGIFEIRQFEAQALQSERVNRAHVDFGAGGSDVIFTRGRGFQEGVNGLAGFAESLDVGPDFLHFGPADLCALRFEDNGLDAGVGGGAAEHAPHVEDGDRRSVSKKREGNFHRRAFGDVAGEVDDEGGAVSDRRRLRF